MARQVSGIPISTTQQSTQQKGERIPLRGTEEFLLGTDIIGFGTVQLDMLQSS